MSLYIFDMDGVIYRGKKLLSGAKEIITSLRQRGDEISFLSNNSTLSRSGYQEKLTKMGIKVDVTESTMSIEGNKPKGAVIETYNDHRMAMSFATAALFAEGDTIINGGEAVTKSYPGFFTDLAQIGARVQEI